MRASPRWRRYCCSSFIRCRLDCKFHTASLTCVPLLEPQQRTPPPVCPQLTKPQVTTLLNHPDSPYINIMGFMYLRHVCAPKELLAWLKPHFGNTAKFSELNDGNETTLGAFLRKIMLEQAHTLPPPPSTSQANPPRPFFPFPIHPPARPPARPAAVVAHPATARGVAGILRLRAAAAAAPRAARGAKGLR